MVQHTFIRSLAKDYARWATDARWAQLKLHAYRLGLAYSVILQADGSFGVLRYRAERLRWAERSDEAVAGAASMPPLSKLTL